MAKIDIVITGDAELNKKLAALTGPEAKRIIRQAAREALRPVLRIAKASAPVKSGRLKKAIKLRALKRSRVRLGARVGTAKGDYQGHDFYAAFQEYGYRLGKRPRYGKGRRDASSAEDKRREIPGKHFLKTAADRGKQEALATYRTFIRQAIEDLVK